ncbi:MAG: glycosyltransferase family 2 protein [Pseudomonadota bacterium]
MNTQTRGQPENAEVDHVQKAPLVSIITPTYNSHQYIGETIASVVAQDYANWEHIIVDDASSDATTSIVEEWAARDPRIKLVKLKSNAGAAVARNTAIDLAKGRFIAFLDADDLWLPHKLSTQIAYMLRTGAAFTYASFRLIDGEGAALGEVRVPASATYHSLLRNNVVGCLTAVYDVQQLGKVMMPLIRKRQDLGLWLRLTKRVEKAEGVEEILAQYRLHEGSMSHNKLNAAKYTWDLYYKVEQLPLPKALYYFAFYAINGLVKSRRGARG